MNRKSASTLTISAVAFIAALLVDLYMIIVYPARWEIIIAVSLIVIVDTYFMVDAILARTDEIAAVNIDKANELTKVEKGIYSVAKREELARTQSMSALLDLLFELKDENTKLAKELLEQEKLLTKLNIKKEQENSQSVVNSSERIAVQLAQIAAASAKSDAETLEILNEIYEALEQRKESEDGEGSTAFPRLKDVI